MKPFHVLLALAPIVIVASACNRAAVAGARESQAKYTCSMHPSYVSDKPGDCPICGMRLTPVAGTDGANRAQAASPPAATAPAAPKPASPSGERKVRFYRNPMNPSDTSPTPKKDPMGMDYVPVYADEVGGSEPGPAGYATVEIDPERRRLIGLKTTRVQRAPLGATIRAVGRLAIDERRQVKVQPRFDGYIEKLAGNYTGKPVRKGETLAEIYSPELVATENELLIALRSEAELRSSGLPHAADAARRRLRQFGVSNDQIDEIARSGQVLHAFRITSPIWGVILTKNVVEGARVTADQPLFDIADLSELWVLADVYESELPRLHTGQKAHMTLTYWPGREWNGRVGFIYPTVDERTRTVRVRIEVDNRAGDLKPEMFANVVLETGGRDSLVVADDAVLDSGTRKLVFVVRGEGRLQPREIRAGVHADGKYEVLGGLNEGDEVAAGASFLLDSESRLRSAIAEAAQGGAAGAEGGAQGPKPAAHPEHTHGGDGGQP
jgi:Cu(I)/Ag(I) efflux system membrane fusion protein